MLVFLMKSGADPTVAGGSYGTLLGAAALRAPVDTLGFVLAKGPGDGGAGLPITLTDRERRNAAHMAVAGLDNGDAQDTIEKLDLLTGHDGGAALLGALDHVGRRPLHLAAASGRTAVVLYLLERGEDAHINDADADGWTPLHWACRQWDAEVVRFLVGRGADRSLRTNQGWLPWHVAIYHENENLEDALKAHGTPAEPGKPTTPAVNSGYWCSSCFVDIFGERWNCDQCTNFDHCFKCHGTAAKIHETDHTFTCHAPLKAETVSMRLDSDGGSAKEDESEAEKEESDAGRAED
ncbi:hypothetical protein MAPG_11900 [Magnaporthiopsis poae ATCC 64411]|uniref:Uncharacterized protein n=1 Tax=Magnaporthiopsis poae (strain ATCC 64411 / 73-15) TaxID=644358 RepID=A0A0C4EGG1_MAGP6|nr:hypothetical protein MAPG_11900 [Magnaporthiopsis poae ATCC 64411]